MVNFESYSYPPETSLGYIETSQGFDGVDVFGSQSMKLEYAVAHVQP
jgi:hypothetical protein